ncbi:hypothetical protein [Pseudodesulfovibrio karagichevae]|uniref:FlxA-like protein n=1 Tax=Pseudodesulfovibrio karagichevae TaxID=3239305 RepID=A0ABV4K3Q2_9BACT
MTVESLLQQTGTFVGTLTIKPTATDKTMAEAAREARIPEQGDTVKISEEARALSAGEESGDAGKTGDSKVSISAEQSQKEKKESEIDQIIRMLKEQIKRTQKEIKELEKSDMPEKLKRTLIQDKQVMLLELNKQLSEALEKKMKNIGSSVGGGTRAEGAGNSAASF